GEGQSWKNLGMGCHNPRLDLDNVGCTSTVTNPDSFEFCAPENINVDFPPKNAWMRIAAYYYSNGIQPYAVHPTVKVFCDGALAAELGSAGFYDPEEPITFTDADGSQTGSGNLFWLVADVAFVDDQCATSGCIVKPLYLDETAKTPYLVTDT